MYGRGFQGEANAPSPVSETLPAGDPHGCMVHTMLLHFCIFVDCSVNQMTSRHTYIHVYKYMLLACLCLVEYACPGVSFTLCFDKSQGSYD